MIELRLPENATLGRERELYNSIYDTQGIDHLDSFHLWLIELLNARPDQSLLDVSCGQGRLVQLARQRGINAFGTDFSESATIIASYKAQQNIFSVSDAHLLSFPNDKFDFITNIGSIEHYLDPATGIQEMGRVLKPQGVACILVPNTFSLFGNVKYAAQTGDIYQGFQPIERYDTLNGWRKLLVDNGLVPFDVVKFEIVRPRTKQDLRWFLSHPPKIVRYIAMHFVPLALANSFVYLCHPAK